MKDDPATATDEAHNFAPHFDRHVWVYRENPAGVFEPFNPGGELCAPRREAQRQQASRARPRRRRLASAETGTIVQYPHPSRGLIIRQPHGRRPIA